ncbi:hypothetical protein [Methanosarcina sp. KYL-1]|nr:hypothetical protein [Methanosarcina sp. KYL-1]
MPEGQGKSKFSPIKSKVVLKIRKNKRKIKIKKIKMEVISAYSPVL